jgi:molybdopterin-guanine dinucleotide biosynthesis protein A
MRSRELTLLTGEVDSGKTSWCLSFSKANPDYDGVLLRKVYQAGRRIGYDAVRIASGQALPFSRLEGSEPPSWRPAERVGPFSVSEEGKHAANRWLLEALHSPARGLIVDEIGPLELVGRGLAEAAHSVLQDDASRSLILVVRRSCLEQVIRRYRLAEHRLVEL